MPDSMLTICAIMGLGAKATGDLLGLRPFLESLVEKYPDQVGFLAFEYDQPDLHDVILSLPGDVGLACHSNGAEQEHRIDGLRAAAGKAFEFELYLDAKPEWDSFQEFLDWMNAGYEYPLPLATGKYQAFYSGFGRPFIGEANSTHLNIGHAAFPADAHCQKWLGDAVDAWVKKQVTT
jgi:hypothetical protein